MRAIGAIILLAVFGGIFWATASTDGWRAAVAIWAGSLALTGLIVLGVFLLTGSLT